MAVDFFFDLLVDDSEFEEDRLGVFFGGGGWQRYANAFKLVW